MRCGQSKLAYLLLARELARRSPAITAVTVTPVIVHTDLVRKQTGFIRTERCADGQLWCVATPKEEARPGALYELVGVLAKISSKQREDEEISSQLWEWTDAKLENWD